MKTARFLWFYSLLSSLFVVACAPSGDEGMGFIVELPLKDATTAKVPFDSNPTVLTNYTETLAPSASANPQEETPSGLASKKQALSSVNLTTSLSLAQGASRWFLINATAGTTYHISLLPTSGDPDLSLHRFDQSGRLVRVASSMNSAMRVDRLRYNSPYTERIWVLVYAYSATSFRYSASWEVSNKLALHVPYINQYASIPTVGFAACSSASSVMRLGYDAKIPLNQMASEARKIFDATADTNVGLRGRDRLRDHLINSYRYSSVRFDQSSWLPLYRLIQSEIRAGRPLILGSRSMSSAGHYLVVTGFNGNDYNTAKVIVNDPAGMWGGWNRWSTSSRAENVEYTYKTITSQTSDGVFVLIP